MPIPIRSDTQFNSVVVLQSLRPGDLPTGETLFTQTIKPICDRDGQRSELRLFTSAAEFKQILTEIEEKCRSDGWLPIVHIECHADDIDGIACHPSKEDVSWQELLAMIRNINRICANRVMLVVAGCYGIEALRSIADEDDFLQDVAPFWLILGPEDKIYAPDLEKAMIAFYTEILSGAPITTAIAAHSPPFRAYLSESIFFNGMLRSLKTLHTGPGLEDRIRRLTAATIAQKKLAGEAYDTEQILSDIRARLQPEKFDLERFKRSYLMSGDPRNTGRFSISLQQLLDELKLATKP